MSKPMFYTACYITLSVVRHNLVIRSSELAAPTPWFPRTLATALQQRRGQLDSADACPLYRRQDGVIAQGGAIAHAKVNADYSRGPAPSSAFPVLDIRDAGRSPEFFR